MKKNSVLEFEIGDIVVKAVMKGFWDNEIKSVSLMHNHAWYEFHAVLKGEALLETDNNIFELKIHDTVLVHPEVFHRFKNQDNGSAILSFGFFIDKSRRKSKSRYYDLISEKLNSSGKLIVFDNTKLEEYLIKIAGNIYNNHIFAEEYIKAHFILLFTELFSILAEAGESGSDNSDNITEDDARIFMIEEYFNEYYMEKISLKSLSELLCLSEKQTDRIIKKVFGEGFRSHLCKIRLISAQKLLLDSDKEIKAIAEEVGYQSYNGFYMAFKDKMGQTPESFRNMRHDKLTQI